MSIPKKKERQIESTIVIIANRVGLLIFTQFT